MKQLRFILPVLLLILFAACHSGGNDPAKAVPASAATRLVYTDPTDASRWRLLRNPASNDGRLQLDLAAPAGAAGRGITLVLTCGPAVTWASLNGGAMIANGAYTGELVQKASLQGSELRLLLSQKPGSTQTYGSTAVLSLALTLNPGAAPGGVPLTAAQGAHLASSATPETVDVLVGTLQAQ